MSADPTAGTVLHGAYVNSYFDLSYPLPPGWKQGLKGPKPSRQAYYSLTELVPGDDQKAVILIAAQDAFFAPESLRDAGAVTTGIGQTTAQIGGTTIDLPPSDVTISSRSFSRIDFSGVGLFSACSRRRSVAIY